MANGRTGSRNRIGWIIGGIIIVLLLAWLLGLFGGDEVDEGEGLATEEGAEVEVEDGEVEVDD